MQQLASLWDKEMKIVMLTHDKSEEAGKTFSTYTNPRGMDAASSKEK
jgi:hypothetical protein